MELKSRLGPSFHAITTHGISSPTTQGKCVDDSMHFIKHINTVLSFLFIRSCAAARKMFCEMITEMNEWDQRKLDDKGKQTLYIFFYLFIFFKIVESVIRYNIKSQRRFQLNDEIYLPNRKTESVNYKNRGLCKCRLAY